MAHWIYFIHAPRENFAATMTDEEREVWSHHFQRLKQLLADGTLILAGPTLGEINTGIAVFEAPDVAAAEAIVAADPITISGLGRTELREFRLSLLRGA